MKIAIVGTGISGLVAARHLHAQHDLTLFEAADHVGGHTNTLEVTEGGQSLAVDTGFIVFNEKTYPNFCELLDSIGVSYQPSDMSFSVSCDNTGLEYNGTSLNGLFAQRKNLFSRRFWRMASDIKRFYREAAEWRDSSSEDTTLGEFLRRGEYSDTFVKQHLVPMSAAIWSARPEVIQRFPMRFLVQFFDNHGFLQFRDRPQWQVIKGGSKQYIEPLIEPFRDAIRLSTPIVSVGRDHLGVTLETKAGDRHRFDRVILACHSDQALRMLKDASALETDVLQGFGYQRNLATLHTDESIMPTSRRAWAAWNYHVTKPVAELPTVTYWMNELQSLQAEQQYFVTLNRAEAVDPDRVLREIVYYHPIYSRKSVQSQARFEEVDGSDRVHFCGAYWGFGFHEDGVSSGLRAADRLNQFAQDGVAKPQATPSILDGVRS